ncbi:MAG: cation-transporting P-type ATPase [Desulfobacterales bacterium]|nr:cation-transporting P-type ATPase [Desulfobacterales bacterium]
MCTENKYWSQSCHEVLESLQVSLQTGLDRQEIQRRLKKYGSNRLRQIKRKNSLSILFEQFKSLIMGLLVIAAGISFVFGQTMEGYAVIIVILLTAVIGFFTEIKAVRSMESLRKLSLVQTNVRRNGQVSQIAATKLVPGDIVLLESGDIVTGDMRVIESNKLQVNESTLTGESFPITKNTDPLDGKTELAERTNMLFKGTAVTRGSGLGVVVTTGMSTELGHISALVEDAKEEITPLEKRLDRLGQRLIWLSIAIAIMVAVAGIISGKELLLMFETSIALAVAAIPEGLPIVATVALARGMLEMAKCNALVNRLSSVETLGATNVIFTDKTGTLTENKMTVTKLVFDEDEIEYSSAGKTEPNIKGFEISAPKNRLLHEALETGVLCSNASLSKEQVEKNQDGVGDPMEIALLAAGASANIFRYDLLKDLPEKREEAFDTDTKMMATFHKKKDIFHVAVKGAPEMVLDSCSTILTKDGPKDLTEEKNNRLKDANTGMALNGLRVLALATKKVETLDAFPYKNLTFIAMVGLLDPARSEIKEAIASCKAAGIQLIMVTGDQPVTARHIASKIEMVERSDAEVIRGNEINNFQDMSGEEKNRILDIQIFARVSPKQKLDLISLYQEKGAIVGMTGDGVNDAPALKKADIGIAMGNRGTQVAQEAADMVLKDDAFATIIIAIEHGRVIFNNIRKFILFLLSGNVGEIIAVGTASLINSPLPLLPLQILFINLLLDVFPALALGLGKGVPGIMQKPPRDPSEPILTGKHWKSIFGYGALISLSVLCALWIALYWFKMPKAQAVTISFLTLGFSRLGHTFNMRDTDSGLFKNEITGNPFVWWALLLCSVLLPAAVFIPGLAQILQLEDPGRQGWLLICGMSLVPLFFGQVFKMFRKIKNQGADS